MPKFTSNHHPEDLVKPTYLFLWVLLMSACAPLPPTPQDIAAKKFQPVPGKAVIYIVRPGVDSFNAGPLSLSGVGPIATHQGTYYRWEVEPGMRSMETAGASLSVVTINARAGQLYFVLHTVTGGLRSGLGNAWLQRIDEQTGRRMVSAAQHL
jgi:hypothetical protein